MNLKNYDCTARPCAAAGLTSYRYRGPFGWIMIGAQDDADALRQAQRSTHAVVMPAQLEIWSGAAYTPVSAPSRADA